MKKEHRFSVGDKIRNKRSKSEYTRVIYNLLPDGTYEWKYPFADDIFVSSNSSDPYLEFWEKYY